MNEYPGGAFAVLVQESFYEGHVEGVIEPTRRRGEGEFVLIIVVKL